MSLDIRFRPIDNWPGALRTNAERTSPQFSARYTDTLDVLERELNHLDAERVVIQLALAPSDIRLDGFPRANARPDHPGVIVSFDSKHGPLRYLTDVFTGRSVWRSSASGGSWHMPGWQANVRAIALGLEALRKVDRYGITKRGEQYRGWAELPTGIAQPASHMTTDEAARFIAEQSGLGAFMVDEIAHEAIYRRHAYKSAVKRLHPDVGGDADLFQRLQVAKQLLDRKGS